MTAVLSAIRRPLITLLLDVRLYGSTVSAGPANLVVVASLYR